MQPLLAHRVGLKPRITEGYERATGLVAAFRERETRRIFGEWRSHIGRDARPKGEIRFAPLSWKAPPLPPLLGGVAESVALAPISACSRIGSAPVPPSLRSQAHGRSRLGHSPSQRQGDRHTRAQAVGEALGVAVGIGRFYADPQGLGASLPSGPLRGSGRDNERRSLGRDAALHIRAWVRSRHGAFRQAAFGGAAHAAVDADPQGSRERR